MCIYIYTLHCAMNICICNETIIKKDSATRFKIRRELLNLSICRHKLSILSNILDSTIDLERAVV